MNCLLYPGDPAHPGNPEVVLPNHGTTLVRAACQVCGRHSASLVVASMIKDWTNYHRAEVSKWLADRTARPPIDASGNPIPDDAFPDVELRRRYLWQYVPGT